MRTFTFMFAMSRWFAPFAGSLNRATPSPNRGKLSPVPTIPNHRSLPPQAHQVPLRQPLIHRRRQQQKTSVAIDRSKIPHGFH